MGVYIKGMEMPTSCDECPMFNLDIDGGCYCTKYFVIRKKDQDRPDWCPLVPVPPHGDLIDREAARGSIKPWSPEDERNGCTFDTVKKLMHTMLDRAPTIIPADPAADTFWGEEYAEAKGFDPVEGET